MINQEAFFTTVPTEKRRYVYLTTPCVHCAKKRVMYVQLVIFFCDYFVSNMKNVPIVVIVTVVKKASWLIMTVRKVW